MLLNGEPILATAEQLAAILGVSRAGVFDLARRGVIPRTARGRYDVAQAVRGYLAHVRAERGDPDVAALRRARAELAQLRAEQARRSLARATGDELLPLAVVEAEYRVAFSVMWAELFKVPAAVAPRLLYLQKPVEAFKVLDAAMHEAATAAHRNAVRVLGVEPGVTPDPFTDPPSAH